METNLPNIFNYIDFKQYLTDYRKVRKEIDPGFTNQYICFCLGQEKSKSYFNNIISGRKQITSVFVDRFIELLNLDSDGAKYFRALVNYNQTTSSKEKEYHFEQIISLNNTPRKIIEKDVYEYFTKWYHSPIREFLDIYDFDGDYKKLANHLDPKITEKDALNSVKLLKDLDLVRENEKGFLKSSDKVIKTGGVIKDAIIEQYQLKTLDRAKDKIVSDSAKHMTSTVTFSASPETMKLIAKKINKLKSEICSASHKDVGKEKKVYEILIHAHSQTT